MKQFFCIVFLISMSLNISAQRSSLTTLEVKEFFEMSLSFQNGLLIDIREERFYKRNRLEGAIWGGKKDVLKPILKSKSKEIPIFLYCDEGKRSIQAGEWILLQGFTNVYHLKGGIQAWKKQGYSIQTK